MNAAFAQMRFDLDVLEGARIAAGVRHNIPSDGRSKTVWDLSGELEINEYFYGRGRVGTAFRLPSAYELYVVDPCCEQGNPNLVAEESFNFEAGVGGRHGRFSWEAIGFLRDVEDLITIDFDLPDFPDGLIVNSDQEVEVEGFELIGMLQASPTRVSATVDYTYSDAAEKGSSDQLDDIPEDMAKLIVDWRGTDLPLAAGGHRELRRRRVRHRRAAASVASSRATTRWSTSAPPSPSMRSDTIGSGCASSTRSTRSTTPGS